MARRKNSAELFDILSRLAREGSQPPPPQQAWPAVFKKLGVFKKSSSSTDSGGKDFKDENRGSPPSRLPQPQPARPEALEKDRPEVRHESALPAGAAASAASLKVGGEAEGPPWERRSGYRGFLSILSPRLGKRPEKSLRKNRLDDPLSLEPTPGSMDPIPGSLDPTPDAGDLSPAASPGEEGSSPPLAEERRRDPGQRSDLFEVSVPLLKEPLLEEPVLKDLEPIAAVPVSSIPVSGGEEAVWTPVVGGPAAIPADLPVHISARDSPAAVGRISPEAQKSPAPPSEPKFPAIAVSPPGSTSRRALEAPRSPAGLPRLPESRAAASWKDSFRRWSFQQWGAAGKKAMEAVLGDEVLKSLRNALEIRLGTLLAGALAVAIVAVLTILFVQSKLQDKPLQSNSPAEQDAAAPGAGETAAGLELIPPAPTAAPDIRNVQNGSSAPGAAVEKGNEIVAQAAPKEDGPPKESGAALPPAEPVVGGSKTESPAAGNETKFYIQVQSFLLSEHYKLLAAYVGELGFSNLHQFPMNRVDGDPVYYLRLGPYASRDDAKRDLSAFLEMIRKKPFKALPRLKLQLAFINSVSNEPCLCHPR